MQYGMDLVPRNPDRRDLITAGLRHENAAVKRLLQFLQEVGLKGAG